MLTRQKIKGHFVMLSFSVFLVTSCQNDDSTKSESSAENKEVTVQKTTLKMSILIVACSWEMIKCFI